MQKRKGNLPTSSSKFRSRSASPYTPSPSKPARAVRAIHVGGDGSSSESDISVSDSEEEQRRIYSATAAGPRRIEQTNVRPSQDWVTAGMIRILQKDTSRALIVGRKYMMIVDARNGWRARSADAEVTPLTSVSTGAQRGGLREGGNCPMEKFYNILECFLMKLRRC